MFLVRFSLYVEKQVSFGDVKSGGGANVGQKMIREKKVAKVLKAVAVGLLLLLLLGRGTAGDVIYALNYCQVNGGGRHQRPRTRGNM